MVLTQEQRVELLARARAAKAKKRVSVKEEEPEDEEVVINVPEPAPEPVPEPAPKPVPEPAPAPKKKTGRKPKEIVALPIPVEVIQIEEPVPKKKALPVKWLKKVAEPVNVYSEEKLTKETPVINDELPEIVKHLVTPPVKEVKKVRVPRASTRTLDIVAEPKAIEDVMDEVKNNDMKYRPQKKQAPVATATQPPTAPIQIIRTETALRLFDY